MLVDGERLERLEPLWPDSTSSCCWSPAAAAPAPRARTSPRRSPSRAPELPDADVGPNDLATILYTSGTTGNPKGAMATHRNHVTNLMNTLLGGAVARAMAGLTAPPDPNAPQPGALADLPLLPHRGLERPLHRRRDRHRNSPSCTNGRRSRACGSSRTHGLTSVAGVPIVVRQLLEAARNSGAALGTLMGVASGGAPVPPDLIRTIGEQFQARAAPGNGYGLTETTSAIIANGGADYLAHPDSIGRPGVTADVRIVDESGRDVATGEIGELWLRGPNVIPGYWKNPEATEAAFGGGWFRSGDLGLRDEAGLYYVVDRMKDVIIRGGENVYCAEVEAALLEHPRVRDAAVVGLPHQDYGEEVAAVIQVAAGALRQRRRHPREPLRSPGAVQDPDHHPPRRGRPAANGHRQDPQARAEDAVLHL